MIEQHTLTYIASGIYLNGNRASDVFQLKGPDAAAACYAATCTASWTYDARDRLSQEVNGSGTTTTFTLDIVGNVTSEAPSGGTTITRTYSGQQLATQSSGGTTTKFLYDALGNQDCKVKSTFAGNSCPATGSDLLEDWVYDYKNRLTAYTSYDGSGNLVNSVSYTNDPLDRPVQQTSTESGSTTNYELSYLGASDQLSKEVLTGATATTKKYAYDAFGRRATLTDGANRYSYQYDPHGSVSMLLDQTGAPKASYGYSAYGNPNNALTKTAAGFNAKTNPYRYTGKRADPGSATLDMGARRYLPATGRFLQYDYYNGSLANLGLALNPLSSNRYALAAGNPVNYVETDGHAVAAVDEETGATTQLQYDGGSYWRPYVAVADPWDPAYAVPGERTEEATSVVPLPGNGGPGGGRVGGGSAAGGGGRATPRVQRPALDPGTKFGAKIEGQLRARGWTKRLVESTIRNPARIVKTRDIRAVEGGGRMNDPATVYYSARGGYVVRNNRTGDIVQISNRLNPNWRAPWDR